MVASFLTMVKLLTSFCMNQISKIIIIHQIICKKSFLLLFEMSDRSLGTSTVAYGIERMNMEVSHWMRGLIEEDSSPHMPFIATKGYDSVVWNRLYSRDISDLENYQINQASVPTKMFYTYVPSGTKITCSLADKCYS